MKKSKLLAISLALSLIGTGCAVKPASDSTNPPATTEQSPIVTTLPTVHEVTEPKPPVNTPRLTVAATFSSEQEQTLSDDDVVLFIEEIPYLTVYAEGNPNIPKIISAFSNRVNSDAVTSLRESGQSMAIECYEPGVNWIPYSLSQRYEATRIDEHVFSISGCLDYNFGGVHPNHRLDSMTFDLTTGKLLSLTDVIKDESCLHILAEKVLGSLADLGEETRLFDDYVSVVMDHFSPESSLFGSWYLNDNGLVLYFSVYEISSYAAGDFVFEYSYAELQEVLREEFLPQPDDTVEGSLTAELVMGKRNPPPLASIYLVNDGSEVLISAEGELTAVRIECGRWSADRSMFLVEKNLFASNRLGSDTTVFLQCILQDTAPNLRISYRSAGGDFSRYLSIDYETGTLKLLNGAK